MKKTKKLLFLPAFLFLFLLTLTACGNNQAEAAYDERLVDVITSATSANGSTPEELIAAMSPEGAWVFSMRNDITVEGPLAIEGNVLRHQYGTWQDFYMRVIAMYFRDGRYGRPEGNANLTVTDGIHITSPNTHLNGRIHYGNPSHIYADVHVNSYDFRLRDVIVHGDLTFETESMKERAYAHFWNEAEWELEARELSDLVTGEVLVAASE